MLYLRIVMVKDSVKGKKSSVVHVGCCVREISERRYPEAIFIPVILCDQVTAFIIVIADAQTIVPERMVGKNKGSLWQEPHFDWKSR